MAETGKVEEAEVADVEVTDEMEGELSAMGMGSEDDPEITEAVSE